MVQGSKVFAPHRCLGYVSNHIPLQLRYIKNRKEHLIVTCAGKFFLTYGISHFSLLSVSGIHPSDITCMTSDTYHIYTACENVIYAWRRGTELKHVYRGHAKSVHLMLPFGIHLISIDEGNKVKVWDIINENVLLELLFPIQSFKISAVAHPKTYINKILFGSKQGSMQLWNVNNSKLIYSFKGWDSSITCLEQAPALDVVAVGLASGKIILHNLKYDETVMEFVQDWGLVTSITFRTDGHPIMATGSTNGHIVFWNLEDQKVASQLVSAHEGAVTGMICVPNEPLILTSSPDNTLKLWIFDMTDGSARLLRIREGHSSASTCIRFHGSNGHNILSAGNDSSLRIFNTQTEQFNKSLGVASYNRKVSKKRKKNAEDSLRMPPIVFFASETTREKEWDGIAAIHSGLPLVTTWSYNKKKMGDYKLLPERLHKKKLKTECSVTATCLTLTKCGNFVIVGYTDGYVDRFNIQSGMWRTSYGNPSAHDTTVRGTAVDSLNNVVITGGSDAKIKFWTFNGKETTPLRTLSIEESINFIRSHPESSLISVTTDFFSILVIDVSSKSIVRKFWGHKAQITDATFSPDSRWLITSAMDCTIKTWDIPSSQLIDHFKTEVPCISLSMSPTGEFLATVHLDNLGVFLWSNRSIYSRVSLKNLSPSDEPPLMMLPEIINEGIKVEDDDEDEDELNKEFISKCQISDELVTLSELRNSRWQNIFNMDIIKQKNKPKEAPKVFKSAPFFLPTVASLTPKFDFSKNNENKEQGNVITLDKNFHTFSPFGELLDKTKELNNFENVVETLKSMAPSMIDFEIKLLDPDVGGTVDVMVQFLKCIEHMLNSNNNFELAQAYLATFLKQHFKTVMVEPKLVSMLPTLQNCHSSTWNRVQDRMLYSLCVVQALKLFDQ
ncbi:WD repeat-containing protein 36 [Agrilus planipennis]|uniref:WD repeat-containing protein 36 n=1 Tax=Agrilus planipennis TaxID=224129 RepID=A0A1W4XNP5_AGRPL|nr:WD repeat-containing protein 36 [Agrilus planipennis]